MNPPWMQPQSGTWSGEGEAGAREKLGKTGKSLISQAARSTTCWQNSLFAKKCSFLKEEGNGAVSGAAEGRGGLADGFWGLGGMLRQQMSKIQRRAAFWGKGVGVWGQSGHLKEKKKSSLFLVFAS